MKNQRGTGRTTRMLQEAKRLAEQGSNVYVILASQMHMDLIAGSEDGRECLELGVRFETPTRFDWREVRLRGAHPNCIGLVDHFAIESHFEKILEMLHRFDRD